MRTLTPIQAKTPFRLDARPLREATSPHAGALALSRVFRSLKTPDLIAANLPLKSRQRGFTEGQLIESILVLQAIGGDCPEDIHLLDKDKCLERGLGYAPPKTTAVRTFLERFHDEQLEELRPEREKQKSFIVPSSSAVEGLQQVQAGLVQRIARLYGQQGQAQQIATLDQDATIIESHKQAALPHYDGGRGYQPMVAVWAEADLVVADQFRDGNVPAKQGPLTCAKMAFAALPATVRTRYFRGDSGCHESDLISWLNHTDRQKEPGGKIGFAISAVMSQELAKEMTQLKEKEWKTFDTEEDGTLRQWAEVAFVPSEKSEHKDSWPLRYVGLRLLKAQGQLFADGSDRHHHAVITNMDQEGARLLNWHREKAGTVEHVYDEVKNALGGGHMPSQRFAVNAAWFKLALMTYNLVSAIRGLCLEGKERTARLQRFRLLLIQVAGRMNRNNCVMGLRLCAEKATIARLQRVWKVFELRTQATSFQPVGRRDG